jgi:hypothetical protein
LLVAIFGGRARFHGNEFGSAGVAFDDAGASALPRARRANHFRACLVAARASARRAIDGLALGEPGFVTRNELLRVIAAAGSVRLADPLCAFR